MRKRMHWALVVLLALLLGGVSQGKWWQQNDDSKVAPGVWVERVSLDESEEKILRFLGVNTQVYQVDVLSLGEGEVRFMLRAWIDYYRYGELQAQEPSRTLWGSGFHPRQAQEGLSIEVAFTQLNSMASPGEWVVSFTSNGGTGWIRPTIDLRPEGEVTGPVSILRNEPIKVGLGEPAILQVWAYKDRGEGRVQYGPTLPSQVFSGNPIAMDQLLENDHVYLLRLAAEIEQIRHLRADDMFIGMTREDLDRFLSYVESMTNDSQGRLTEVKLKGVTLVFDQGVLVDLSERPSRSAAELPPLSLLRERLVSQELEARRQAAIHLGLLGSQAAEAWEALVLVLQEEDVILRTNTIWALGELGVVGSIEALQPLVQDPEVRLHASRAISKIRQ